MSSSMRIPAISAAILAASFFTGSPASALSPPPPEPTSALVQFYMATGGEDWKRNDGWLDSSVPMCDWYGVVCNNEFGSPVFSGLSLPDNNLSGSINDLDLIHFMFERLDLSGNALTGSLDRIPFWISFVDLSRNFLGGSLPEVTAGRLIGTLPPDYFHGLSYLNLSGNEFRGEVPADWDRMALSVLDLSNNQLEGGIENAFAAIRKANGGELYLQDNLFGGTLSPTVASTTLWETDLPASGGGLNLCWNDLIVEDEGLVDFIDRHHVAGPGWQGCLNRERVAIDASVSGSWFSPARSGEGVSLMLLDNGAPLVYSFTYDRDGEQLWFFEVGRSGEKHLNWPTLIETRGDFNVGLRMVEDEPALRSVARLRMDRLGDGVMQFERVFLDYSGCPPFDGLPPEEGDPIPLPCPVSSISDRSPQIQLTRLAGTRCDNQAQMQWTSGAWFSPERSGEGFIIEALSDDRAVVYWFTYTADGSGQQVWLTGDGRFDGERLRIETLYQPTGGVYGPGFESGDIVLSDWGSLELNFGDESSVEAAFASSRSEFGSGQFSLVRLAQPMLASCD